MSIKPTFKLEYLSENNQMVKLTDKFINDVLSYGESLVGIPYKW